MTFRLTDKQQAAQEVCASDATHIMLFGGSRCVAGDTVLDGHSATIAELAARGEPVLVQTTRGLVWAEAPFLKGYASDMLDVLLSDGRRCVVTADHRFWRAGVSGGEWVKAAQVQVGDALAVRSSGRVLPASSLARALSALRQDALCWTQKAADWLDRCSQYFRRYGQPLRPSPADGQACRASQSGEQAHSRLGLNLPGLAWQVRVSGSHKAHLWPRVAADSRSGLSYIHPSNRDAYRRSHLAPELSGLGCAQTSAPFRGSRAGDGQSRLLSCLVQSAQSAWDSVAYRCARWLGFSWDTPKVGAYDLAYVLTVTPAPEQAYYTLHVPVAEQYFANGILHHNSGKTFLLMRNIVMRALKAPRSRHVVFRQRFNAVKASVWLDTFPKVMEVAFPGVPYLLNKTDFIATFANGSEIWFAGLDDKERTEKVLGMEFATIYLNECSQIAWEARNIALTRLAQQVTQQIAGLSDAGALKPRMYYDCNPPTKAHWTYRLFKERLDPDTRMPLRNPGDVASFQINPHDNRANIAAGYLETLESMAPRLRKRFLDGEFGDATPGALFSDTVIDMWRHEGELPDMVRVVVAVDPSGSGDADNADNDAIGIVVAGLGVDGVAYVMEDCTVKAGPATWGGVVASAFDRHQADAVVGETNYGGAMVNMVVQSARARTPFRAVTASRGKHVRAEPFSALYEQGKVRHAGRFLELEDELCAFSTTGYLGSASPNRADALIWALAELFPAMTAPRKPPPAPVRMPTMRTGFSRRV